MMQIIILKIDYKNLFVYNYVMREFESKLKVLPHEPGVYLMKDEYGHVIYVGKAKDLKKRVWQYFHRKQEIQKVKNMVDSVRDLDYFVVTSEYDALALENNLIKKYQPHYNILLKDSKSYAYIKINLKQKFPRFEISRKLGNGKYFGPFFAGLKADDILEIINYAYPLRKCKSMPKKACLYYQMGLCSAPCENKINEVDYNLIVNSAIKFLNGDIKNIEDILKEKMMKASKSENFETALKLRDMLKVLERLKSKIITQLRTDANYDVFAFETIGSLSALCLIVVRGGKMLGVRTFDILNFINETEVYGQFLTQYYSSNPYLCDEIIVSNFFEGIDAFKEFIFNKYKVKPNITVANKGVKLNLLNICKNNAKLHIQKNIEENLKNENLTLGALQKLKNSLNLSVLPKRIECYDISNTFGVDTVASMSVLINGNKAKSHYRKFRIKNVDFIDDFKAMEEVLTRRFEKISSDDESFSSMPDLIILDGGKGQLNSAISILKKFNYKNDVISIAKRLDEIFIPNKTESIFLKRGDESLRLVQLARDEAHRFAITYNRSLRNKNTYKGGLQAISGVGPATRQLLLSHFKTISNIQSASLEDLQSVKGINKKVAKNVFDAFHKS